MKGTRTHTHAGAFTSTHTHPKVRNDRLTTKGILIYHNTMAAHTDMQIIYTMQIHKNTHAQRIDRPKHPLDRQRCVHCGDTYNEVNGKLPTSPTDRTLTIVHAHTLVYTLHTQR